MHCCCHIVPAEVLRRLAEDQSLPSDVRRALLETAKVDALIRATRDQAGKLTRATLSVARGANRIAAAPAISVFDCRHSTSLPGAPIARPAQSSDKTVVQCLEHTTKVAEFYKQVFGRNSIDDAGLALVSSVHYGVGYNNAFWNGFQMSYGDGDGSIFTDFTKSSDVICHELTHGLTQHSLQLVYRNEPGGLNESISDVFGSMYRQWLADQTVGRADWLIGREIMGPTATGKGIKCLRDMSNPAADHCLSPQIDHFSKYKPGMDPHDSSGVANLAFYKAARAVGGKSWEKVGQVWYKAITGSGPSPTMKMKKFADRTRQLAVDMFPGAPADAIHQAWADVGL